MAGLLSFWGRDADWGENFSRQRLLTNGEQIGSPLVPQEAEDP
jgi:hypothetical protein